MGISRFNFEYFTNESDEKETFSCMAKSYSESFNKLLGECRVSGTSVKMIESIVEEKTRYRDEVPIKIFTTDGLEGGNLTSQDAPNGEEWNNGQKGKRHDCFGAVYAIINQKNGKAYIGQTCYELRQRLKQHINVAFNPNNRLHNSPLMVAFREYGPESFQMWELSRHVDRESLDKAEIAAIKKYHTNGFAGYNSSSGGTLSGFTYNKSMKDKLSDRMRSDKNVFRGKHLSAETKAKIGYANSGERSSWTGKKHSESELKKITDGIHKFWKEHPEAGGKIAKRMMKRVVCIETGVEYESLNAAADCYGVCASSITMSCRHGRIVRGVHFAYVGKNKESERSEK